MIASINPATGETLRVFEPDDDPGIECKLGRAAEAFGSHRTTTIGRRAEWMRRAADILEAEAEPLARTMALEMGKPVRQGRDEARKCAACCRYYAENAARFLADELIATDAAQSFVRYEPLGAVLAIMPWNFPLWQVVRFAAPALMAGNVGVLKHSSNVPQCALALEGLFARAGFGQGAFQALFIGSGKVARVLSDDRIRAATLTGSEPAGREVAGLAGRLIKKTVLELGGSDPFIVMPGADLDKAVSTAVKSRCINSGQSCIAAKRFIIHEKIYGEFESRFAAAMRAQKIGDPLDEAADIGPLATAQILEEVEKQVVQSVSAGARVITGGSRIAGRGNFFEATILADVPESAPAFREEVFGPVAALYRVRDIDGALALANATPFGLGASAWTSDAGERERLVSGLQTGQVFINAMVGSDPRLPFGGVKNSGYGRELGREGIREFVNVKTVSISG